MRRRIDPFDAAGWLAGVVTIGITVFALVYLLWLQPFYAGSSYRAFGPFFAGGWEAEERTETVEGGATVLVVRNVSGPVRVEGWGQDSVQVHYVKEARTRAALEQFPVEIEARGGTVTVRPVYRPGPRALFGSVSFDIRVPAGIRRVEIHNVSGTAVTAGLPADVELLLSTVSGRIAAEQAGPIRAQSTSGRIEFASAGDRIEVKTVSGGIEGRILGLSPRGSVEIESVSGGVRLEAFEGLNATVVLRSTSGAVSSELPMQTSTMRRSSLEGVIGAGGAAVRVRTMSGAIRLEALD